MIPYYTVKDFRSALLNLLPMGPIWSRGEGGMIWIWATLIGESYTRNSGRAIELLKVAFPATTTELIEEWEKTLGLPDSCIGVVEDIKERQMFVVDRLVSSIESSRAFYIAYAKKYFGFDITIDQYAPFRFGTRFGRPFGNTDWSHTWQVNLREDQIQYHPLQFGSAFGQSFATWDLGFLPCIFKRLAPVHTYVLYGIFSQDLTS